MNSMYLPSSTVPAPGAEPGGDASVRKMVDDYIRKVCVAFVKRQRLPEKQIEQQFDSADISAKNGGHEQGHRAYIASDGYVVGILR